MSDAKAKTINLLLYEGNLTGVISIEDSSWNSGELYSAPRDSISDLLNTDACKKYGVYLLLSKDMVYVGQSSVLAKRINQHLVGKDWWESVVILTTKDDSLTHTDIDFLEAVLIDKAMKIGRLDCDNKNKGNNPKVDKFREVFLGQFLDEALFLMQLIGITVFCDSSCKQGKSLIDTIDVNTKLALGRRAKAEAIEYLKEHEIAVRKASTYAVLSNDGSEFWANPQTKLLNDDWDIILNDNSKMELIVLQVPANELKIATDIENGLIVRTDKKSMINLKIDARNYIEKNSGIDFSRYICNRISY